MASGSVNFRNFCYVQSVDMHFTRKQGQTLPDTRRDIEKAFTDAHEGDIHALQYGQAPYGGQFTLELDAAETCALHWLVSHSFHSDAEGKLHMWPRYLIEAFMSENPTWGQLLAVAQFFWNVRVDPYHVAQWYSARGVFPVNGEENAVKTEKRDKFMAHYNYLEELCPGRPTHFNDDIVKWMLLDLQFFRYVAQCLPQVSMFSESYFYGHTHWSQIDSLAPPEQGAYNAKKRKCMRGPSQDGYGLVYFPDPAQEDSWDTSNDWF
jgi:hypothetical protein